MFVFLSIALCLALVSFGGTEPEGWLGLTLFWTAGLAVWVVYAAFRERRIDLRFVLLAIGCAALAVFADPRLALGPIAGTTAWMASRSHRKALPMFLHVLLGIGVLEALLGLFQYLVAPGWIFGYVNTYYPTSGTLINKNHFAGLLGMIIPVAVGLAYVAWARHRDLARCYVYLLAGSLMGLALVFSLSRMGILVLLVTLSVMSVLVRLSLRAGRASALALVPLCLVLAGTMWMGMGVVVERYSHLVAGGNTVSQRLTVFADTIRMIRDNPLGIGPGAYADQFRRYQSADHALLFDHAHNDYLETAAEWGLPVAVAVWAFVFLVFARAIRAFLATRQRERRGILLAVIGGILSILVHSLADFNLQIPSNAMLFSAYIGIAAAAIEGWGLRDAASERAAPSPLAT